MSQTTREEFARWLREQLRSQGWMVSDFAQSVGVRPSAVYRWTAGQRTPTDSHVEKISQALKVSPEVVWEALARSGVTPSPPSTRQERATPPTAPAAPDAQRPFARWLREQLAARGWSTGVFARRLDLDPVTVRAWLNGVRDPATVQLPRIAEALAVDVETVRSVLES